MRILFIGINYWPEKTATAPFTTGRAEYLAARGHDVTVVTAFPYYPEWRIAEPYRGRLFTREDRNGVRILRCLLYVPRHVTSVRRMLHEATFMASATARAIATRRPDVMFVTSPPLSTALSALILGAVWRVPYVFQVEDLQPDTAADLGMLSKGPLMRSLYTLERITYRRAALVSTITEAMRRRIIEKSVPSARVALFSDWSDPGFLEVPLGTNGAGFRARFGLEGRFIVVHVGNMGVKQGLDVIIEAAGITAARVPEVAWLIVGDGAMRPRLEDRARALRLDNLRIMPLLPAADFHRLLAAADVCLITQRRSVRDIVFPSKVLTLLAAGRPVLASISPGSEIARVLEESGAGLTVAPEDPLALAAAATTLSTDPSRLRAMGRRGRAYAVDHWERSRVLAHLESRLSAMFDPGRLHRPASETVRNHTGP